MNKNDNTLKSVIIALAGNAFVTLIKFLGYIFTLSPTMLAEALHSTADVLNQFLLFVGIKSSGQKSKQHPWGMGSIQYLFNFISAMGIFSLGCIFTLWHTFSTHTEVTDGKWFIVNLAILVISFFIEGFSCLKAIEYIWKEKGDVHLWTYLIKSEDPTLIAVFLEDSAAIFGIVTAIIGVTLSEIFHNPVFDIIASSIIGVLMGIIAIFLGLSNASFLIGRSVGNDREEEYKYFIESLESVEKVTELRTEVLGPKRIHISIKVELHPALIINTAHLKQSAEEIREGEPIIKILMEVAHRSVRATGREIVSIERKILKEFPEIISIDFEQN